jgi:hypothetical protein
VGNFLAFKIHARKGRNVDNGSSIEHRGKIRGKIWKKRKKLVSG